MEKMRSQFLAMSLAAAFALTTAAALAAPAKTYQVTGPILEVTPTLIVVQKGNDRWEIARDAQTKITGELKVGAKVTIEYRMTATAVAVKADQTEKKK